MDIPQAAVCVVASQIANFVESYIGAVLQDKEDFQWVSIYSLWNNNGNNYFLLGAVNNEIDKKCYCIYLDVVKQRCCQCD